MKVKNWHKSKFAPIFALSYRHCPQSMFRHSTKRMVVAEQELIRRWDTRTWRDVSSYLFTYLLLNYDTLVLPEYFLSKPNAYLLHI